MVKNSLTILVFCLTFFISASIFSAEEQAVEKELDLGVLIEIYEDGRVKPIENNSHFSENELDIILTEIGYPYSFISRQSTDRKRDLVGLGGRLVDGNVKMTEEYVSKTGEVYEITPFNKSKVRAIQESDLKDMNVPEEEFNNYNLVDEGFSLMSCTPAYFEPGSGFCQEGKWTGMLMALKTGETSVSYKYNMMLDFSWQGTTNTNFGDSAAIFWGNIGQPVGGTERLTFLTLNANGTQTRSTHGADVSSTLAVKGDFFLAPVDSNIQAQAGLLEQEVFINKGLRNHDLTIAGAYAHPWTPNFGTISIGTGGIDFSFTSNFGSRWSWQLNFNPN